MLKQISIKKFFPLLVLVVLSFTSTHASLCSSERTDLYNTLIKNNATTLTNYWSFLNTCANPIALPTNTSVTADCTTNTSASALTDMQTVCQQSFTLSNTNTTFSGKWCTFSISWSPKPFYNTTNKIVFGICDTSDCSGNSTSMNNTQVNCYTSSLFSIVLKNTFGNIKIPSNSTCTYACGGFPVWAIIVIVLVVIAVVVIIVVVIVVMLRRKSSYQNI
jgi:hypothetical protein